MNKLTRWRNHECCTALAAISVATVLISAASVSAVAAPAPTKDSFVSADTVIATIGKKRITQAEVVAASKDAFDAQQIDYDRQLRQMQFEFSAARQEVLQQQLDKQLDRRALEMEAKSRGVSTNTVIADIKVAPVTEDEIHAFYEANKARTTLSYEQLAPKIRQYLASQHDTSATRGFFDSLRVKYDIRSKLEPYRVVVAANGPSLGNADAPVTIVEFGDFQCPYCKEAEATVHAVLARHPGDVRLIFRNLPQTQLHANALTAAEAGICAEHQGKFWPMHDAMYADQSALDDTGLKNDAKRIGLDPELFAACMSDTATRHQIEADMKEAQDLALAGTPYFFINGRPINGSVPQDKFEAVIADELRRVNEPQG